MSTTRSWENLAYYVDGYPIEGNINYRHLSQRYLLNSTHRNGPLADVARMTKPGYVLRYARPPKIGCNPFICSVDSLVSAHDSGVRNPHYPLS